jgi:hypothetical protein
MIHRGAGRGRRFILVRFDKGADLLDSAGDDRREVEVLQAEPARRTLAPACATLLPTARPQPSCIVESSRISSHAGTDHRLHGNPASRSGAQTGRQLCFQLDCLKRPDPYAYTAPCFAVLRFATGPPTSAQRRTFVPAPIVGID